MLFLKFILRTGADIFGLICFMRFFLQIAKIHYGHQLAQFCVKGSNWLVLPLRRGLPAIKQWDTASVMAAWVIYFVSFTLISVLGIMEGGHFSGKLVLFNVLISVLMTIKSAAYVFIGALLLQAILSMTAPTADILPALHRLTAKSRAPFHFLRLGQFDFSGTVVLLILLWLTGTILPTLTRLLESYLFV